MEYIFIRDIAKYEDQEICLKGWVRNTRHSGKLVFIIVRWIWRNSSCCFST